MKLAINLLLLILSLFAQIPLVTAQHHVSESISHSISNPIPVKQRRNFDAYADKIEKRHIWTRIDTLALEISIEGGTAIFYYVQQKLLKITAESYGELYKDFAIYYIKNGNLVVVDELQHTYNRPMYYESAAMKDNDDTEYFDPEKSTLCHHCNYFFNNNLRYQDSKGDCRNPSSNQSNEEKRILENYQILLKLIKS